MNSQPVFIEDNEIEWSEVEPGIKRKIMACEPNLMMVKVSFGKGRVGALHNHFHSQVTYIKSGSFEVIIKGERKVLSEGDVFYIPPHAEHGVVCLEEGVLIDVFTPMREDFINNKPDSEI